MLGKVQKAPARLQMNCEVLEFLDTRQLVSAALASRAALDFSHSGLRYRGVEGVADGTKESADLTSVIYDRSSARVSGDLRLGMDVLSRLPYSHVIASRLTRSGSQPPLAGREYMQCPSCVHSPLSRPCTGGLC